MQMLSCVSSCLAGALGLSQNERETKVKKPNADELAFLSLQSENEEFIFQAAPTENEVLFTLFRKGENRERIVCNQAVLPWAKP